MFQEQFFNTTAGNPSKPEHFLTSFQRILKMCFTLKQAVYKQASPGSCFKKSLRVSNNCDLIVKKFYKWYKINFLQ